MVEHGHIKLNANFLKTKLNQNALDLLFRNFGLFPFLKTVASTNIK